MDIRKTNNMNKILYSSYRSHHSTIAKIEKTESTFGNQMSESSNYLTIIDEFYQSLRRKRDKKRQTELFHKHPVDQMVDLIVDLVKAYNDHYISLLNHDHQFNTNKHAPLAAELKRFKFNLSQIGLHISDRNLLKINTTDLKKKLNESSTCIDFIFEKNGLIDHLQKLYEDKVLKNNMTHFDKKV